MQFLNLYVKGFDFTTNEPELETFFGEFGQVKNVKIVPDRGFGFVSFFDKESAKRAKDQAPLKLFKGKNLTVNYCEPKESRQAHIEDMKAYEEKKGMEFLSTKVPSTGSDIGSLIGTIGAMVQVLSLN